jgi:hypothetical protein
LPRSIDVFLLQSCLIKYSSLYWMLYLTMALDFRKGGEYQEVK